MNEKQIMIVRCGEVALKGMNKPYFEKMLADRIKRLTHRLGDVTVTRHEGLIFVHADKEIDRETLIKDISKAFGVDSISPAYIPLPPPRFRQGPAQPLLPGLLNPRRMLLICL